MLLDLWLGDPHPAQLRDLSHAMVLRSTGVGGPVVVHELGWTEAMDAALLDGSQRALEQPALDEDRRRLAARVVDRAARLRSDNGAVIGVPARLDRSVGQRK